MVASLLTNIAAPCKECSAISQGMCICTDIETLSSLNEKLTIKRRSGKAVLTPHLCKFQNSQLIKIYLGHHKIYMPV